MAEEKRRCKVISQYNEPEGTFIKFGQGVFTNDSGQQFPIDKAFVELDDGKIISTSPEGIRFI